MNFFCEIIIKEQYHLFEKQIPDIHYDIFTFNTIEKSENFNI